jgi:hypothetical protein
MFYSTCGILKVESEYNWRNRLKDYKWGACKGCQRIQQRNWYSKNKERHIRNVRINRDKAISEGQQFVLNYLDTHPFVDCRETRENRRSGNGLSPVSSG